MGSAEKRESRHYTRREFLTRATQIGGAGLGAYAMASALAACGGNDSSSSGGKLEAVKNGNELDFAVCLPVSGPFTIITVPWTQAIRYAVEERNAAGGLKIGTKKIKVKAPLYDEGYAAAPALKSMRKFTSQGGHYVGGLVSVEAPQAVQGINQRANLLEVLGITGSDVALTYNNLRFYEYELAQAIGPAKADFAFNQLGLRKIATIELKNTWGNDYQQSFAKTFEALGGEIVKRDYMLVTDTDFTGIISSWKPLKPDGIYIIIGDGPGVAIGKQLVELGFEDQPILTEGAWDPNSYIEGGKDFIERCYYSAQYPYSHWSKTNSEFAERLYKEHKLYLTNWFWHGYDSTRMVLDAMELADSTSPQDVMEALPKAVKNGSDKWMIKATGAIATQKKGVYLKTPMWISKFKPANIDFLSEPCLAPVKDKKYQNIPGWMPSKWAGYKQDPSKIQPLTSQQLKKLSTQS